MEEEEAQKLGFNLKNKSFKIHLILQPKIKTTTIRQHHNFIKKSSFTIIACLLIRSLEKTHIPQ